VVGRQLGVADAINAYAMFRLSVAYRQDDLAPLAGLVEHAVQAAPTLAAWRAVHAACLADSDAPSARAQLEAFTELRRSSTLFAPIGWAFAARAARTLGLPVLAQSAAAALEPWANQLLIAGAGAACFGPADLAAADAMEVFDPGGAAVRRRAGDEQLRLMGASRWCSS
jgi:hypothetical protein